MIHSSSVPVIQRKGLAEEEAMENQLLSRTACAASFIFIYFICDRACTCPQVSKREERRERGEGRGERCPHQGLML